ncbi:MAG: hypothetical protein U0670_04145 [Anaerolineae bacterium]
MTIFLFFTADTLLDAPMIRQHYVTWSKAVHIVMWAAWIAYGRQWAGSRKSWWLWFSGGAFVIALVFYGIVPNLSLLVAAFGSALIIFGIVVFPLTILFASVLILTWLDAELSKDRIFQRLLLMGLFFIPFYATGQTLIARVEIPRHTAYNDHQYFIEDRTWGWCSDICEVTTLYECNALGFACREIPQSEETSIEW